MPNKFNLADFPNFRTEMRIIKENHPLAKFYPVGSCETVAGDEYEDIDILCCIDQNDLEPFKVFLQDGDWLRDQNQQYNEEQFLSYRALFNDQVFNLLVSTDRNFVNRFLKAATLCKHLNLTRKNQRVFVHEMFVSGTLLKAIEEIEV